jgi:hypothetical protein
MPLPPRRPSASKTRRLACTGLLAMAVATPGAGASQPSSHFDATEACTGATVTREYTADSMTYRLHLDLDGCRWWDGSARNLVIWLSRDDGTGPASRYSMMPCESGSDPGSARPSTCEVFAALPHPTAEQAVTYQGEATWEWKEGTQRASFDSRCTTAPNGEAACDDRTGG